MKKLILLLFIPLVFGCSDDENTPNMCIDESLINSDVACPAVVDPVCGCDGNTYNNKDLETVESLEHEDFLGFAHTGQVVEGSKQHIEMSKQFLDQFPNAKWEILWSISSDINFKNKPTENWVTTCLNTSFGEGENKNNFQRIFDAQIVDGKIKKAYLYQRDMSDREMD